MKAVLVFMKENTTVDEFKILKDFKDVKGKKIAMQVCADVEDKCMAALLALEGRNEKGNEKAFVTGVASRLADVGKGIGGPDKKKLKREASGGGEAREQEEEKKEEARAGVRGGGGSKTNSSVGGLVSSVTNFFKPTTNITKI